HLAERQENGGVPFRRDARTVIADGHVERVADLTGQEQDVSIRPVMMLEGIVEKITQNELERRGESDQSRPLAFDLDREFTAARVARGDAFNEGACIDLVESVHLAAGPSVVEDRKS